MIHKKDNYSLQQSTNNVLRLNNFSINFLFLNLFNVHKNASEHLFVFAVPHSEPHMLMTAFGRIILIIISVHVTISTATGTYKISSELNIYKHLEMLT